jgi:hypothetical protein
VCVEITAHMNGLDDGREAIKSSTGKIRNEDDKKYGLTLARRMSSEFCYEVLFSANLKYEN